MSVPYFYPSHNRHAPPLKREDVTLGDEDVLFHIRSDEPYMLINQDGSWPHVVACVLAYVMQRKDIFDLYLQSWRGELLKDPQRWEMFKPVLRERAVFPENKAQDAQKRLQRDERERDDKDSQLLLISFCKRFEGLWKGFGFRAWIKSWRGRSSFEEQPLHVKILLVSVANTTWRKKD